MAAVVDQNEQCPRFVGGQSGHVGTKPRQQTDSPMTATLSIDGYARSRQRFDVAHDGARRHFQACRQLRTGHPLMGLQQQEYRQEPVGSHRLSGIHVACCHISMRCSVAITTEGAIMGRGEPKAVHLAGACYAAWTTGELFAAF